MATQQTWLVTGSSTGLGLEITRLALAAGHKVIASCRNPSKDPATTAELENLGATWLDLDVSADDVETKIASVVSQHGKIDVVVNNAGYGMAGSIEDTSLEQVQAIFATNFYGPLRIIRALLPTMRASGGTIVNVSSSTGINAVPGLGIYSSTKFALEGLSEALYAELAPFNIRVLLVVPGGLATKFVDLQGRGVQVPFSKAYEGTTSKQVVDYIMSTHEANGADPVKAAQRIVEAVDGTGMLEGRDIGLRLPLGSAGGDLEKKSKEFTDLSVNAKDICKSIEA